MRKNHDAKVAELARWLFEYADSGDNGVVELHAIQDKLDDALAEAYQDGEVDERKLVIDHIRKRIKARQPEAEAKKHVPALFALGAMQALVEELTEDRHNPGHPPPRPSWVA